jgi:hypothetical protein
MTNTFSSTKIEKIAFEIEDSLLKDTFVEFLAKFSDMNAFIIVQ